MTRTTCEVWGVAGDPRSGRPTSSQSRTDPPFRSPSSSAAAFKPCDDLPRYRTDFVTYCSATRYFHLPLHTASLQQALDAASQVESATLPRFNRDTRDTGCKRERMRDTVLVGDTCGRIKRDTVSPAYCPAATTLPCRSAREEKVTLNVTLNRYVQHGMLLKRTYYVGVLAKCLVVEQRLSFLLPLSCNGRSLDIHQKSPHALTYQKVPP